MNNPVFTVVIPTYNYAHYLKKSLASLISQTYPNWEAIVVNNFSTDDTEAVVAQFNDPRIKLVNFKNNGVIAASRNEGIVRAKGEYVAFLDSDDYWYDNKLEACLKFMKETNIEFICNGEHLYDNGKIVATWLHSSQKKVSFLKLLLFGNRIGTSAVVVKKTILDDVGSFSIDAKINTAEDFDLWLRILKKGYQFSFVNEVLGGHLQHVASQSLAVQKNFNAVKTVVDKHLVLVENSFLRKLYRLQCYSVIYYASSRQYLLLSHHFKLSLQSIFKAIYYNPFRVKNYFILGRILFCRLKTRSS